LWVRCAPRFAARELPGASAPPTRHDPRAGYGIGIPGVWGRDRRVGKPIVLGLHVRGWLAHPGLGALTTGRAGAPQRLREFLVTSEAVGSTIGRSWETVRNDHSREREDTLRATRLTILAFGPLLLVAGIGGPAAAATQPASRQDGPNPLEGESPVTVGVDAPACACDTGYGLTVDYSSAGGLCVAEGGTGDLVRDIDLAYHRGVLRCSRSWERISGQAEGLRAGGAAPFPVKDAGVSTPKGAADSPGQIEVSGPLD
jgi:hypothetical protein